MKIRRNLSSEDENCVIVLFYGLVKKPKSGGLTVNRKKQIATAARRANPHRLLVFFHRLLQQMPRAAFSAAHA